VRWMVAHGFPEAASSNVSTQLCQLRQENEIYKDDDDLKWRMARRADERRPA